MANNNEKKSWFGWLKKAILLALLVIGLLLIFAQAFINSGNVIQSWFVFTKHPESYRFPIYNQLLKDNVKGKLIDYKHLVSQKALLDKAISELKSISADKMSNEAEQVCFWVNAHNLLVLKIICDKYPITDVQKLAEDFNLREFIVGGHTYSVERIKSSCIVPILKHNDVKILFTLYDGTTGGPCLIDHILTPEHLAEDAMIACVYYVNDQHNVHYNETANIFYLSPFFRWNEDLICRNYKSTFDFANTFIFTKNKVDLTYFRLKTTYSSIYNWQLNDTTLNPSKKQI